MSKTIYVLCDSRGDGLQEKMDNTKPNRFVVRSVSSAGLVMAATKFLAEMIKVNPEYVSIASGICEVTLKNKLTKKYTLKNSDIDDSVKPYVKAREEAVSLIHNVLPNTRVIFNPITGVDLQDYNSKALNGLTGEALKEYHELKPIHPMQRILNDSIVSVVCQEFRSFGSVRETFWGECACTHRQIKPCRENRNNLKLGAN